MHPPAARCLDITRLASRAGTHLTGVDRVELAYAKALIDDPVPTFGLCQMKRGCHLLDQRGLERFVAKVAAGRASRNTVRLLSRARCLHRFLPRMLSRRLPDGTAYLNVGHSRMSEDFVAALRQGPNLRIAVMLHDVIPMDWPDVQTEAAREKTIALGHAAEAADLIITISEYSAERAAHWFPGIKDRVAVAHLGVDVPEADPGAPERYGLTAPYAVVLGTIEPRKNHALLLDVWDQLGAEAPHLAIIGSRGWKNADVFARLDAGPPRIHELGALSDADAAGVVQGADVMLFPSRVEGFGLPPAEALALGTPVICSDLPVLREFLGDFPVYLDPDDNYAWVNVIKRRMTGDHGPRESRQSGDPRRYEPPTWDTHFKKVLAKT